MTRAEIVAALSTQASPEAKQAALAAMASLPLEESMAIMREATEVQAAHNAALAEAARAERSSRKSSSTPADVAAPTPACVTAQEGAARPQTPESMDIPEAELWAYFDEEGIGDAKLYNRLHRGRIVWVRYWQRFLVWSGHHWKEDDDNEAYQCIEAVIRQYERLQNTQESISRDPAATPEERQKAEGRAQSVKRRIRALSSKVGMENLLAMVARVKKPLLIVPKVLDQRPYLLPCPNGVVDLKTGEFRAGRQTDWLYAACATEFDPELLQKEDPCPETNAFLMSSMNGDADLVDFIWRLLGYGLIRERGDHVFSVWWGPHGRNGKDTLIKLVTGVVGEMLSTDVPVEMFLQTAQTRNSSSPTPDVLQLKGACFGWINEAEDNQRFAMARLKKLTGGGQISARGLLDKKATQWKQTHLPIMTTNEIPRSKSEDSAFWGRMHVLKWELSFVDNPVEDYQRPADKQLDSKLRPEYKGVLARMVRGAMDYIRDGRLQLPAKVRAWTKDERDRMDDVADFLTECCLPLEEPHEEVKDYRHKIRAKDLNDAWVLWYGQNRDRRNIPSAKALGLMLDKREIRKHMSNGTWRLGLELNPEWVVMVAEKQDGDDRKNGRSRRSDDGWGGNTSSSFQPSF